MSPLLRVLLIIGSITALFIVVQRVRKQRIRVQDSVFWVVCTTLLVVLALFPHIAFFFSGILGFVSPSNFVFLVLIGLMIVKIFSLSCDVSRLTDKVEQLSQEIALDRGGKDGAGEPKER